MVLDLRSKDFVINLDKHLDEPCKIKWDFQGNYMCSGGNDNKIFIWDIRKLKAVQCYKEHKAAVRALDWNPWHYGTLISGGGTQDRKIKFWNINKQESIWTIHAKS